MAFNRFVTRYADATSDQAFVEELGPVLAVHNAAIFNHLLAQLLSREIVDPTKAINAQLVVWRLLWGRNGEPGLLNQLEGEEHDAAVRVLEKVRARTTTLRALSFNVDYEMPPELRSELRGVVTRLIVDPTFALDARLIRAADPDPDQASALLLNLELLAGELTRREVADLVLGPLGGTYHDVEWNRGAVLRTDAATGKKREYQVETLIVSRSLDDLDHDAIRAALERFAVATYLAREEEDYWRIRFAGNGSDVGYWDAALGIGLTDVDGDDQDFDEFDPAWPKWLLRLENLQSEVGRRRVSA
jgi:hypothetical protein